METYKTIILLFSMDKLNFLIEDGGHFVIVLKAIQMKTSLRT